VPHKNGPNAYLSEALDDYRLSGNLAARPQNRLLSLLVLHEILLGYPAESEILFKKTSLRRAPTSAHSALVPHYKESRGWSKTGVDRFRGPEHSVVDRTNTPKALALTGPFGLIMLRY